MKPNSLHPHAKGEYFPMHCFQLEVKIWHSFQHFPSVFSAFPFVSGKKYTTAKKYFYMQWRTIGYMFVQFPFASRLFVWVSERSRKSALGKNNQKKKKSFLCEKTGSFCLTVSAHKLQPSDNRDFAWLQLGMKILNFQCQMLCYCRTQIWDLLFVLGFDVKTRTFPREISDCMFGFVLAIGNKCWSPKTSIISKDCNCTWHLWKTDATIVQVPVSNGHLTRAKSICSYFCHRPHTLCSYIHTAWQTGLPGSKIIDRGTWRLIGWGTLSSNLFRYIQVGPASSEQG